MKRTMKKTMKKISFALLIFFVFAVCLGCETSADPMIGNDLKYTVNDDCEIWNLQKVELKIELFDSQNIICRPANYTRIGDDVYYIVNEEIKQSTQCIGSSIIKYDLEDGSRETVYHVAYEGGSGGIPVLVSAGTHLFWTENVKNWRILGLEAQTKQVRVIKEKSYEENEKVLNLSSIGDQVVWYRLVSDQNQSEALIETYDYESGETDKVETTKLRLETPYASVPRSDRYMLYVTQSDDALVIHRRDIETDHDFQLRVDSEKIIVMATNEDYILWSTDWRGGDIFLYSFEDNMICRVFSLSSIESLRSAIFTECGIVFDFSSVSLSTVGKKANAIMYLDLKEQILYPVYVATKEINSVSWLKKEVNGFSVKAYERIEDQPVRFVYFFEKEQ